MPDISKFEFCPRCGAVTRDGQCQSCGCRESDMQGQYSGAQGQYSGIQQGSGELQQGAYQYPYQDAQSNPYQSSYQNMYPNMYPGMYPPAGQMPKKKGGGTAVVAALAVLLVIAVFGVSFAAFYSLGRGGAKDPRDYTWFIGDDKVDRDRDKNQGGEGDRDREPGTTDPQTPDQTVPEREPVEGEYYEELYSALRDDLHYQIRMEEGRFTLQEYENVEVNVSYPQISGNVENLEYLNEILEYEYQYYLEYFTYEYEPDMEPDSYYICLADCYITYMDENVMSVVFKEELLLDWFSAINFYCLNFNMKDGVLMNNTEMLHMDQDFALEFRKREIKENGDNWLTDYSDQEILQMLRDPDYLVIFYTPMGMEVGLNMQEVVLYVTFADYQKFLGSY